MGTISVVINTLNEEKNLPRALSSIKNFADEIVVVDMKSEDKTQFMAKEYGAKVYEHDRVGYVEPARNFAISKATSDWIFILDSDEEVPLTLKNELKKIVAHPTGDYFRIPRKNIIFGKWIKHSRWWPDYNIRFFKKGSVSWSEIIHSVPVTSGVGIDLEPKEEIAITHYNYESIEQYLERLNRYTTLHAKLRLRDGYTFDWKDIIEKPTNEFLSRYFHGEGYKDGLHGLALSGLQAFSEFILYLKIWQMSKFPESRIGIEDVVSKMKESESDLHFWQSDALLKEVGGLKHRIKRKFRLS
ncbi:hypothetical protein A2714_05585 [Candidatus Woesebacteria bacterium RIFCSPHIGHO2_01_FULL_38_9]|uniref:Glycosyltransferase 2-like domain-containing protein n=2 Tax=Candidatus Woeseibacteriota TaxID=1752722 RepID=A0A1F7Y372_9BACT|nr:MAG: hypothetical protein A2714_05585 [Candidatus Woesebacteria bacterium RIFCSPHIGHO2_01_FULL_38_9]OGM60104.1 MAG: hypothetical protein A3A75_01730 [Candidatus Woesebacteria bacterium RIFCSPLOWO2_01_FULL_39_10]